MNTGISAINEAVKEASAFTQPLFNELGKVIVGQQYLTERLVIGLLANGHVLLEGVPGLAKTLAVLIGIPEIYVVAVVSVSAIVSVAVDVDAPSTNAVTSYIVVDFGRFAKMTFWLVVTG